MRDFLLSLDLELFAKIKKDLVSPHFHFSLLLVTQGLDKIKQSFQFFGQKTWFLGNNRPLP